MIRVTFRLVKVTNQKTQSFFGIQFFFGRTKNIEIISLDLGLCLVFWKQELYIKQEMKYSRNASRLAKS